MACFGVRFSIIYPKGKTCEHPRPVMGLALLFYIPQEPPTCLHSLLLGQLYCYISHRKHLRASTACNGACFTIIIPQETPTSLHCQLWGLVYYYISHRKQLRASTVYYGASFPIIYPTGNNHEPPRPVTVLALLLYIPQEKSTSLHGL
jgi:hypothetical protein